MSFQKHRIVFRTGAGLGVENVRGGCGLEDYSFTDVRRERARLPNSYGPGRV